MKAYRLPFIAILICYLHISVHAQCPTLSPITGPDQPQWCENFILYNYSIPNVADAGLVWSLFPLGPPNSVVFVGPDTGASVDIHMVSEYNFTICAAPTNPCYNPTPICMTVEPLPGYVMDPLPHITVCPGDEVNVNFSGTGDYYYWEQGQLNYPYIGLGQNGIGDLNFIAVNSGNTPLINVIGSAPWVGNCQGYLNPTFNITVNPTPTITQPPDLTVCGGSTVNVAFSGTPGATFNWTNDNPNIGLPASGSGNLNFSTANPATQEVATITVDAQFGGCPSVPKTFQLTVNPTPVLDPPPNLTLCAGEPLDVPLNPAPPGSVVNWTNSNPTIGLAAAGSGSINVPTALVDKVENALVTLKPQLGVCPGSPVSFTVQVKPTPELDPVPDVLVCAGEPVSVVFGATPGAVLNWSNSNAAIGLQPFGVGNIAFTAANVQQTQSGLITVSPDLNGCQSEQVIFQITVKKCCETFAGNMDTLGSAVCGPKPIPVNFLQNDSLEMGDSLHFILYSNPGNPTGSVLYETDTLYFPFLPGLTAFDSTFYVSAIAGNGLAGDSIDRADPCLDVSNPQPVRWLAKPTISAVSTGHELCANGGCMTVDFVFTGHPPFAFAWVLEQGGQVLYSRSEVAAGFALSVEVCAEDFFLPYLGGNLDFRVTGLVDAFCDCAD
jgi:hypothetical protein